MGHASELALFRDLERFGDSLSDPILKEAISCAEYIDGELRAGRVDMNDAVDTVKALDNDLWQPFLGRKVKLTACVQPIMPADTPHESYVWRNDVLYDEKYVDEQEFDSRGFCIVDDECGNQAIKLLFHHTKKNEFGRDRSEFCAAPLSSLVEFDDIMSEKYIRALLDAHVPDLIQDVDERVLGGARNRGEALLALRGLDLEEIDWLETKEEVRERVTDALCLYAAKVISLDSTVPYTLGYSGKFVLTMPTGHPASAVMECTDAAVSLHSIRAITRGLHEEEGSGKKQLAVQSTLHTSANPALDHRGFLYIDNIDRASSIRDSLYWG